MNCRRIEENLFIGLMLVSLAIIIGSLVSVFAVVILKGIPALSFSMITKTPEGGYYLGREGGILNAIVGSLYLATGASILSFLFSLPIALYVYEYAPNTWQSVFIRLSLNVLAGIPSIVFGAFAFTLMLIIGAKTSLLWGIITVSLFLIPIMTRAIDEVLSTVSPKLRETSLALGSTKLEFLTKVIIRQILPGLLTAILISFGRAIGDAAAVLLTTGYTDNIPRALTDPAATLPLAIFFQLATPIPEVQQRAYASGVILLVIIMMLSILSRILTKRLMRYVIK